jgi:hypothetical protein
MARGSRPTTGVEATELRTSHRRAVASRLAALLELAAQARLAGVQSPTLDELEATARRLAAATGSELPADGPGRLLAVLTQAHVITYELEPRRLRSYGSLSEEDAAFLAREAAALRELTERLLDEYEDG